MKDEAIKIEPIAHIRTDFATSSEFRGRRGALPVPKERLYLCLNTGIRMRFAA